MWGRNELRPHTFTQSVDANQNIQYPKEFLCDLFIVLLDLAIASQASLYRMNT
ncbi:MAG: hypothetical protein HC899_04820 [Leptolyngbyaceae cyanobacterium SM1_4_3]|nr:hypothetical protein [Leptolyngbyaceae cyanobacterium SM1_4_3]